MDVQELDAKLGGVFAPITTPFAEDESVDLGALRYNLELYAQTQLRGYMAIGSNGENKSLTEKEKLLVLETVIQHKGQDQVVMAGATYDAQRDTERFIRNAADLGADFGVVLPPSYFRAQMTDDVLYRYYLTVADASPDPHPAVQRAQVLRAGPVARAGGPVGATPQHCRHQGQRVQRDRSLYRTCQG